MAIALVANRGDALGINGGTSGTINSSGANLIVLGVASYQPSAAPTAGGITDSKSNVGWVESGAYDDGSNVRVQLFYHVAPTVGSGHTFTVSASTTYVGLTVAAFSGVHASPFDADDGGSGVGITNLSPATGITPAAANALVVSVLAGSLDLGTITVPTSYTLTDSVPNTPGTAFPVSMSYRILGAAAAQDPDWSWVNTALAATIVASFLPAAGGGAKPWLFRSYTHTLGAEAGTAK